MSFKDVTQSRLFQSRRILMSALIYFFRSHLQPRQKPTSRENSGRRRRELNVRRRRAPTERRSKPSRCAPSSAAPAGLGASPQSLGSRRCVGWKMAAFRYTHAVVCRIPLSLRTRGQIELDEAKKQHEAYVRLLRELGIDVIELPPDEALPECVFVEDTAVVCNGTALITKPGAQHRAKEVETIRVVLKKELDLPIIEISDPKAKLDGGDVLFTGREFFVGISQWTNEAGASAVAAAFPEYPCTPIKVPDPKHLKTYVTVGGPDLLCVGAGKEAQEVLKRMEREATFSYQTLTLPEDEAANVLYLNGTLVHRSMDEIPQSFKVFSEKIDYPRRSVNISQLAKTSCGLTSSCILVRRSRHIRNL